MVCDGKIVSEARTIWKKLSDETGVKSSKLYSYAVSNRYEHRSYLLENKQNFSPSPSSTSNEDNEVHYNTENKNISFSFLMKKSDFESLVEEKELLSGASRKRIRTILKNDSWEDTIAAHIYKNLKVKHGFHFKNYDLNRAATFGK